MSKKLYSERKSPTKKVWNLKQVLKLFYSIYQDFENKDYFSEYFGWSDYNDNFQSGKLGYDDERINIKIFRMSKKENLYPIWQNYQNYSEEDLFDIIELLHKYCTINSEKPDFKEEYSWDGLSSLSSYDYYYLNFKQTEDYQLFQLNSDFIFYLHKIAKQEFRDEINEILVEYEDGFCLNEEGQIESLKLDGLEQIINVKLPKIERKLGENINQKVEEAVKIFRRQGDLTEKQSAIKQLADVLEHFKKDYNVRILSKDENDLFQIANQFAIRHFDLKQKLDYPQDFYYSWIFHVFLATFHLWARLIVDKKVLKIVKK